MKELVSHRLQYCKHLATPTRCDRVGLWASQRCPSFKISELPKTQQSRTLWQAIERWMKEATETKAQDEDACGPRVTFFDEEEALAYNATVGSRVIEHHATKRESRTASATTAATASEGVKKYGHHHQHRRRRSEQSSSPGSEAFPKRAVDVGIVWWTSDLHGRHP